MLRLGLFWGPLCLLLCGSAGAATADPAIERGDYLVNAILACGNCHSPRDANGEIIKDKALSGGRVFSTPAFVVATSNITPDPETGIGSWSNAEIKRALIEGIRPEHHRLPGVPLAAIMPANFYKALLPEDLDAIVAYLRSVKPVRNEISDPVYKAPIHRDPYPDAENGFDKSAFTDPLEALSATDLSSAEKADAETQWASKSAEALARSAGSDAVAQSFRTKSRKNHGVYGPYANRRQHQDDRFGTSRHVNREPVALIDAKAAQRRRHSFHFVK